MNVPIDELQHKLRFSPHSSLGGIYNIRRHSHLLRLLNLSPLSRHVSFRANSNTPPPSDTRLESEPKSVATIKPPPADKPEEPMESARSTKTRRLERRNLYDSRGHLVATQGKRDTPVRPQTPTTTTKPLQIGVLRKSAERRCKTATTHAETVGRSAGFHLVALPLKQTPRPSTAIASPNKTLPDKRLRQPETTLMNRRSLQNPKRYAPDRSSNMRQTVSIPERPRTAIVTSMNNDQLLLRPCSVDCPQTKVRRLGNGIPSHTAARAAIRQAKANTNETE